MYSGKNSLRKHGVDVEFLPRTDVVGRLEVVPLEDVFDLDLVSLGDLGEVLALAHLVKDPVVARPALRLLGRLRFGLAPFAGFLSGLAAPGGGLGRLGGGLGRGLASPGFGRTGLAPAQQHESKRCDSA